MGTKKTMRLTVSFITFLLIINKSLSDENDPVLAKDENEMVKSENKFWYRTLSDSMSIVPTLQPIRVPPTETPVLRVPPTQMPFIRVPPTEQPIMRVPPTSPPVLRVPPTSPPVL